MDGAPNSNLYVDPLQRYERPQKHEKMGGLESYGSPKVIGNITI